MRTALAAVLVGCASAMAHADVPTLPASALAATSEAPFRIVQVSHQFDQPVLGAQSAPASEAGITPGAVALAMLALCGIGLGAIPRQTAGESKAPTA